MALLQGNNSFH